MKIMKCIRILLITFSLLSPLFLACDKEKNKPENCNPIYFYSLTAENDTIESGGETAVTAEAQGDGLVYEWTKTLGVINGSGSSVVYVATPCATGEIEITCKVIDVCGNSESMTLTIQVI
jgi:hypothetical protein